MYTSATTAVSGISASSNKGGRKLRDTIDIDKVLNSLPAAADAPFDAFRRQHDPTCLPNTRTDLLQEVHTWAGGQSNQHIFWLSGLAGTGKSTIARTIARIFFEKQRLGASFFFSRGGGDTGNASKFATSIAKQLANNVPSLKQHICNAIKERRDIAEKTLHDQWRQLVLHPLLKLGENGIQVTYILVVDALDECNNDNNIRIIIRLLREVRLLKTVRLRIFITSRPEVPIRTGFVQMPDAEHQDFVLHNISSSIVDQDIRTFLEHNLHLIAQERSLATGWPGQGIINRLVHSASGLFIWAATVCRFIREGKRLAAKRLKAILENSSTDVNAAEKHLNEIYTTVLQNCISSEYTFEEAEEVRAILKSLLGSISTLLSPLSTLSISKLLSTAQDEVDQTLADLHAILSISKDPTLPLRLHHPSFRDFLYEEARSGEFWVNEKQAHQVLADKCIQLMSTSLRQDVCSVNTPGMLVADAKRNQIEQGLPPEVQYACNYWIDHVQKSSSQLNDNSQVYCFLQEHFLHWLEALGWIGKISEGIHAITALESSISVSKFLALGKLLLTLWIAWRLPRSLELPPRR
jgi:hypothetical protein